VGKRAARIGKLTLLEGIMDASFGLLSRLMELNELRKHLSAAKPNEKVKMHLGEEWWAELDHQQALGFIDRRQQRKRHCRSHSERRS
jgi:hypothetical protein